MTKKELESKTKTELAEICKEKGITRYKGKKMISKEEMIQKIMEKEDDKNDANKMIEESGETSDIDEVKRNRKLYYVETAEVGFLIAFIEPERRSKVNTGKIVNKSTKNRKFKVETSYGAEFVIPFEDVLWVRTGTRWPRGIYNLLKGIKNEDGQNTK